MLTATQPLTLEAVTVRFADAWTPRARLVVGGDRQGDRAERRTLEASTEVVSYLAQLETGDPQDGEAGTIAGWPALGQVCRLRRAVASVSGRRAGDGPEQWASALTSLAPEQADPARRERLWRGHWQIENGLHYVRDVSLGEDACQVRSGLAPAWLRPGSGLAPAWLRPISPPAAPRRSTCCVALASRLSPRRSDATPCTRVRRSPSSVFV